MKKMIQFKQVSKYYQLGSKKVHALDHIDLNVFENEFITIIGKSGSGKSTLLNLLTGIDSHSDGSIMVNNTLLSDDNLKELSNWRGKNIGIVFQFFQLIPDLTVLENVLLPMTFMDQLKKSEQKVRAIRLLKEVGLDTHHNKYPFELSGGEQQRCAIARALANDPPIIVADEPTGNLDSATGESIMKLFTNLNALGKTIIIVTHDQDELMYAHRTIHLQDGQIIQDTRKEVS